jgi:hypothetical protein
MNTQTQTAGSILLTRIVGLIVLALLVLLLDLRNEAPGTMGFDLLPSGTAVTLAVPLENVP